MMQQQYTLELLLPCNQIIIIKLIIIIIKFSNVLTTVSPS